MTPIRLRIESLLEEMRKSQGWLADRAGLKRSTISRLLRGTRIPRATTLARVAQALGVTLGQLVAGTDAEEQVAETGANGPAPVPESAESWLTLRDHYEHTLRRLAELERKHGHLIELLRLEQESSASETKRRQAAEKTVYRYHRALERAVEDLARLQAAAHVLAMAGAARMPSIDTYLPATFSSDGNDG